MFQVNTASRRYSFAREKQTIAKMRLFVLILTQTIGTVILLALNISDYQMTDSHFLPYIVTVY